MPMLLKSDDGKEFELALIADRLPEAQDGFGDDHSATLSFRVATDDDEWEEESPELNLHEVRALREWLDAVGSGEPELTEIDLLEPELNFQVVKDFGENVRLRIRFHLQDRPDEFNVDAETVARHVDLTLPRESIRAAAAQLEKDLADLTGPDKDDLTASEDTGPGALPASPQAEASTPGGEDSGLADLGEGPLDQRTSYPPGAGDGEDNAGNR
jgi:hypothetical protein